MIMIEGTVENIIYENPENGYTVCDIASAGQLITLTGYMPNLTEGERIEAHGDWVTHIEYGDQFKVEYYEKHMPSNEVEIEKFLASGILPGIGKATAKKIVQKFGADSLDIIENEPDRLLVISGLTKKKTDEIYKKYTEIIGVRNVIMFFQQFKISPSSAVRAYNTFGPQTVNVVKENPYRLADCIDGITFTTADGIALELGFEKNSFERISCGVKALMRQIGYLNGHTFLPRASICGYAAQNLDVELGNVENTISDLIASGELRQINMGDYDAVYLKEYYNAEKRVAQKLLEMSEVYYDSDKSYLETMIAEIEEKNGIMLADSQLKAVCSAFENSVLVITGGPGTGKTTIVKTIIELMSNNHKQVMLAAPTGRAAKRMTELTGFEAKTIHRLLEVEYKEGAAEPSFVYNLKNPLDVDAVIVDELSMVDIKLFNDLLDALPLHARLIMVGDKNQLPPVGAGNVLKDLTESGMIPVIALEKVFRQAMKSVIVTNAHRVVHGEMPDLSGSAPDCDFFLLRENSKYNATGKIIDLVTRRLPDAYGYDAVNDIQVLCPGKKGELGTQNLNVLLQQKLNPPAKDKAELHVKGLVFREGDKVMQIKNNYDVPWFKSNENGSGVFNGDIGILTRIDRAADILNVRFDDREAMYSIENAAELDLAYAMTVHKSQGSEFDAVVMPVLAAPPLLAYRNLFYTALTRAKRLLVLVGNEQAVQVMVDNDKKSRRYSALLHFLTVDIDNDLK